MTFVITSSPSAWAAVRTVVVIRNVSSLADDREGFVDAACCSRRSSGPVERRFRSAVCVLFFTKCSLPSSFLLTSDASPVHQNACSSVDTDGLQREEPRGSLLCYSLLAHQFLVWHAFNGQDQLSSVSLWHTSLQFNRRLTGRTGSLRLACDTPVSSLTGV